MGKEQTPMLMESSITGRVYVVTDYRDRGNGAFEVLRKHDVTEQFEALAEKRKAAGA